VIDGHRHHLSVERAVVPHSDFRFVRTFGKLAWLTVQFAGEFRCYLLPVALSRLERHLDPVFDRGDGGRDCSAVTHVTFGAVHLPGSIKTRLLRL